MADVASALGKAGMAGVAGRGERRRFELSLNETFIEVEGLANAVPI